MIKLLSNYYHWLHGKWPAGTVERLPVVGTDGLTNIPGVRIAGDLSGIPLLKFASDTGARAVRALLAEADFTSVRSKSPEILDLAIVGGGVAGISAAMEASRAGLRYQVFEASRPFSTLANFPAGKPIFTYPVGMTPSGGLQYGEQSAIKEGLLEDLERQRCKAGVETVFARVDSVTRNGNLLILRDSEGVETRALRVIIAIGRTGNFRKLGVPGEDLPKVYNRLHDPKEFAGQEVMVVGGGDSAAETAIALATCGARVTLSYRGAELNRPKPENVQQVLALAKDPSAKVSVEHPVSERVTTAASHEMRGNLPPGCLQLELGSKLRALRQNSALLRLQDGTEREIPNDVVFSMIGREPPLEFFRRSGIAISGEWSLWGKIGLALMMVFTLWLYHWKAYLIPGVEPANWWSWLDPNEQSFLHTLKNSASQRAFYYSLAYCLCVSWFGWRRVQRRKTPYVRTQTIVLALMQWIPLFILPELLLPWAGRNEWFASGGPLAGLADQFFPSTDGGTGVEREYWRAYGFILAWPLFIWNWFTAQPLWGWLLVGFVQTFVLIPWMVKRWGKGAYCGWICSCGALAETMGDAHRHKMPHGPVSNRLNMIGQVFLAFALLLLLLRILGWIFPGTSETPSLWTHGFDYLLKGPPAEEHGLPLLNYKYLVDLLWAGVIGVAFYFHFSGRVWCRFACPLAALMHIYARFGKFRIIPEKSKCISCNVCTSVCHQGIDVMNFANKGLPMEDPQCVRCSACVQQCPTGVLAFGRLEPDGRLVLDSLPASALQIQEKAEAKV